MSEPNVKQCMERHLWVIEVTWKRRKDKPTEVVGITTGGALQVLLLSQATAKQLKVPQSWVKPVLYSRRRERAA